MTQILITIDTELSLARYQRGSDADANFRASIDGVTTQGSFGVGWQMDRLDAFGLTGTFFVDPMAALVYGPQIVARMVDPIVTRGHDVQLHIHTEWLQWAKRPPVAARGQNIGDFTLADQITLIAAARDMLIAAGAPAPIAFRAGNYGANDDTLRALAQLGIAWDSSFNAAYRNRACRIGLGDNAINPIARLGISELPVSGLFDAPARIRHAQVCALSAREMVAALDHAADSGCPTFTIVSHSFEMLSRDRLRPNHAVIRRFEALCKHVAVHAGLCGTGFAGLVPPSDDQPSGARLPPGRLRTLARAAEQAIATLRYERL